MRLLELLPLLLAVLDATDRSYAFHLPSGGLGCMAPQQGAARSTPAWPLSASERSCRIITAHAHFVDVASAIRLTAGQASREYATKLEATTSSADCDGEAPRKGTKTKSASQLRWAARVAAGVLLPPQLKNFHNLTELMEALRPSKLAASQGELDGHSAAIAMNHIKRLAAGRRRWTPGHIASGGRGEVSEFLDAYASAVEKSAHNMTVKHLSLAVNALAATYNGSPKGNKDALRRLITPLTLRIVHGRVVNDLPMGELRSLSVSRH